MIEVGEYVRTKDGKIIRFEKFGVYRTHTREINGKYETGTFENKCIISGRCHYKYDNIVKHSKNIIDLIEEGDYVNGQLIEKIYKKEKDKLFFEFLENKDGSYEVMQMCELKNIKSIVTKEQFASMEYKVKE